MIALGHIHFRCDTFCASEVLQLTTTGDAAGFPFFIVIILSASNIALITQLKETATKSAYW